MRDVARVAGVSPSTVSQVLNGNDRICSAETAERVRRVARELGYQPSAIARALARGRTHTIAVLGEYAGDMHALPMLEGVHELAKSFGYHVSVVTPGRDYQRFADRRFDVLLIARDIATADEIAASLAGSNQIVLAAGSSFSRPPSNVLCAWWSNQQGTALLADHLAALGHRRVAYLGEVSLGHGKGDLFAAAASARGMTVIVLRAELGAEDMAIGAAHARQALDLDPRPTALVGRTDAVALGALHALCEAGLRVPDDISLAGYYDFSYSAYLSPSLTTVYTPFRECAVTVLTEALEALDKSPFIPPEPRLLELPAELRVRGSTGRPPC